MVLEHGAAAVEVVPFDGDAVGAEDVEAHRVAVDERRAACSGLEADDSLDGRPLDAQARPVDRDVAGHRVRASDGQRPGGATATAWKNALGEYEPESVTVPPGPTAGGAGEGAGFGAGEGAGAGGDTGLGAGLLGFGEGAGAGDSFVEPEPFAAERRRATSVWPTRTARTPDRPLDRRACLRQGRKGERPHHGRDPLAGRDPQYLDRVAPSLPEGRARRRPVERLRHSDPVAEQAVSVGSRLPLPAECHGPPRLSNEPESEVDLRGRAEDESRPCLTCDRRSESHRATDRDHELFPVRGEAEHVDGVARAFPERRGGGRALHRPRDDSAVTDEPVPVSSGLRRPRERDGLPRPVDESERELRARGGDEHEPKSCGSLHGSSRHGSLARGRRPRSGPS